MKDEKKDAMLELIFADVEDNDAGVVQYKLTRTVSEARADRGKVRLMAKSSPRNLDCTTQAQRFQPR